MTETATGPHTGRTRMLVVVASAVALVVAAVIGAALWRSTRKPAPAASIAAAAPTTVRPSVSAAGSATVNASEAAASAEVIGVYKAYLAAEVAAYATADYQSPELLKYLADPLKGRLVENIRQMQLHGALYVGAPTNSPKVTEVRLGPGTPKATIEDCVDAGSWRLVYKANNSPVPGSDTSRQYLVVTTATLYPGRGWLLNESTIVRDRPC